MLYKGCMNIRVQPVPGKPKYKRPARRECKACGYRTSHRKWTEPACPRCHFEPKPLKSLAGGGKAWRSDVRRGGVHLRSVYHDQVLQAAHADGVSWNEAVRRLLYVGLKAREAGMWPDEFPKLL
jgi:hypothetical protein